MNSNFLSCEISRMHSTMWIRGLMKVRHGKSVEEKKYRGSPWNFCARIYMYTASSEGSAIMIAVIRKELRCKELYYAIFKFWTWLIIAEIMLLPPPLLYLHYFSSKYLIGWFRVLRGHLLYMKAKESGTWFNTLKANEIILRFTYPLMDSLRVKCFSEIQPLHI